MVQRGPSHRGHGWLRCRAGDGPPFGYLECDARRVDSGPLRNARVLHARARSGARARAGASQHLRHGFPPPESGRPASARRVASDHRGPEAHSVSGDQAIAPAALPPTSRREYGPSAMAGIVRLRRHGVEGRGAVFGGGVGQAGARYPCGGAEAVHAGETVCPVAVVDSPCQSPLVRRDRPNVGSS